MELDYLDSQVSQAEENYDQLFERTSKLAKVIEDHPETDYKAPESLKPDVDFGISKEYAQLQMRTLTPLTSQKWVKTQRKISSLDEYFSNYRRSTEKEKIPEAEYDNLSSRKKKLNQEHKKLSNQLKEISTSLNRTIGKELSDTSYNFALNPGSPLKSKRKTKELEREEIDIKSLLEEKEAEIDQKVGKIKDYKAYHDTLLQIDYDMADEEKVGYNLREDIREDQMKRAASKMAKNWEELIKEFEQIESSYQDFRHDWELYKEGKIGKTEIEKHYNLEPTRQRFKDIRSKRDWLHNQVRDLTEKLIITRESSPRETIEPMNQIEELTL